MIIKFKHGIVNIDNVLIIGFGTEEEKESRISFDIGSEKEASFFFKSPYNAKEAFEAIDDALAEDCFYLSISENSVDSITCIQGKRGGFGKEERND